MAFITRIASGDTPCYECGKQCINVEFCHEGASYGAGESNGNSVSLSRNMRVSITANPQFWGFGGVLISGWATYSNGYYDFFDGHDEDHAKDRVCGNVVVGPLLNEQRPDVLYRTVYDPYDSSLSNSAGRRHYGAGGTIDNISRGGAETYLIDRPKGLAAPVGGDLLSCDTVSPTQIFRKFPENYGWGNKISLNTKIYKNLSGAWRLSSLENCHSTGSFYYPPGLLTDCSGDPKQNIRYKENKFGKYEPTQKRVKNDAASSYYNYASGCLPDGAVAGKYTGRFPTGVAGIYRDISQSSFIQARLSYGGQSADGLKNGMVIGIKNDVESKFNNIYTIFDVQDQGTYTSVKFVGTTSENTQPSPLMTTGNFNITIGNSGHWVAFDTYDPQTCCGLDAYGVSDEDKSFCQRNYHIDFRRVFNNPKNIRQSNRDTQWRHIYGFASPIISTASSGVGAVDYSYPSISGGYVILQSGYGTGISTFNASTGQFIESGYPVFEKYLPYYGKFYEIDRCDNATRIDQSMNQMKNRNGTCYSKTATLEVFPDCITQYDSYNECTTNILRYPTNRLPRLSFVYRGCDFNDNCSFDNFGRPLGAWKDQGSVPLDINDLKRQLGGQEIHMFINLSDALGGLKPGSPCPCSCSPPVPQGKLPPEYVTIPSPITFPSLPNFDINPTGYGCKDARYQLDAYKKMLGTGLFLNFAATEFCDPLHTLPQACMPRQPYTTYGYIMNLCGKKDRGRKDVITKAFAKLHQDKTYTNVATGLNIDEPMYWNVACPDPAPYTHPNKKWFHNSSDGVGVSNFTQVGGSGYGFWGLTDNRNQLVAPYFCTEKSTFSCCDQNNPPEFLNYSSSGTVMNVLGTHNGWPTTGVPFFIEIEVDDFCGGCVTKTMKNEPLHIEFSGLGTNFLHGLTNSFGIHGVHTNRYGHNYCHNGNLGNYAVAAAKLDPPTFSCVSGFQSDYCVTGDHLLAQLSTASVGNTCSCVGSTSTTLYPVKVTGSDLVIGYRSSASQKAGSLIEFSGCSNLLSRYLNSDYFPSAGCGYRVFGQLTLTCPGFHQFLTDPRYPEAKYEGNPVSSMWNSSYGCGRHYPARVGEDGDLDLQTTLYIVSEPYVNLFKEIDLKSLKYLDLSECLQPKHFYGGVSDGIFGFCPGDKIWTYGCKPGPNFVGMGGDTCGPVVECSGSTICNTCPSGTGLGQIGCDCGVNTSYEGMDFRRPPANYNLANCGCLCQTPTLIAEYNIAYNPGNGEYSLSLVSGEFAACAMAFWMAGSGANGTVIPPTLVGCAPPCPSMGRNLGVRSSSDWYKYSHGINASVSGIGYELTKPIIGGFCKQMNNSDSEAAIVCTNPNCTIDNDVYSKGCGNPIRIASGNPGEPYTPPSDFLLDDLGGGVAVRKKKCHPEVAIVSKISCLPATGVGGKDKYNLHLSREYHEHNRIWYDKLAVPGNWVCVQHAAGSYRYNDGVCSGCVTIPYAIPADSVTPAYDPPCSIHPSSGLFVNQDFAYSSSFCTSGDRLWNYYNLFYDDGFPSAAYKSYVVRSSSGTFDDCYASFAGSTNPIFGTSAYTTPVGFNGILATNRKHSCVQDYKRCGGELWCNKMLFPRHSYKKGTKIAPFSAPSICISSSEFKNALLDGYDLSVGDHRKLLKEQTLTFADWCKDEVLTVASESIGIDDVVITVDDYLPLIGVIHPGWRFTSDVKSCTSGGSGCQNTLPVHTDHSILAGINAPKTYDIQGFDSMGYYLDAIGVSTTSLVRAKKSDQCLFNPFKILIDVECSTNRIAIKGITTDPPTYLRGVQSWPSTACKSHRSSPVCDCGASSCAFNAGSARGGCQKFFLAEYIGEATSGSFVCDPGNINTPDEFQCNPTTGPNYTACSGGAFNGIKQEVPIGKWIHPAHIFDVDVAGRVSSGFCQFDCHMINPPNPEVTCQTGVYSFLRPFATGEKPLWKGVTCDSLNYYRINPSGFWVNSWGCKNHTYINTSRIYQTECECKQNYVHGLCQSTRRCADYSSCSCFSALDTPTPPALTPGSGWWTEDCGCSTKATSDQPCTDSMIGFTITESI